MLKSTKQSERDALLDRIYAAMETGNVNQARTLLTEYRDVNAEDAEAIRTSVIADYGIAI